MVEPPRTGGKYKLLFGYVYLNKQEERPLVRILKNNHSKYTQSSKRAKTKLVTIRIININFKFELLKKMGIFFLQVSQTLVCNMVCVTLIKEARAMVGHSPVLCFPLQAHLTNSRFCLYNIRNHSCCWQNCKNCFFFSWVVIIDSDTRK